MEDKTLYERLETYILKNMTSEITKANSAH
jgi:hypothetical protein